MAKRRIVAPALPVPSEEAGAELSQVHAQLAEGRAGAALVAALAAWRKQRAPELADLVGLVGRQVDRSMAPLEGTRDAQHARWVELAGLRRSADLGRLLAVLPNTSIAKLRRRFALLAGFEPDPRIVGPVLEAPLRYSSYDAIPLLNAALGIAQRANDARARATLELVIAHLEGQMGWRDRIPKARKTRDGLVGATISLEVRLKITACVGACERLAARERIPSEAELLAETGALARSHAELLDAIHADPDDDNARAVYADALLEAGDPRGELIALQLQKPGSERERVLLKKHMRDWLGVLDTVITKATFARGFLDTCHVKGGKAARQTRGNPMWSTVRELHCNEMPLVVDPAFRSLRRATITPEALGELARRGSPVPLEAALEPWFDTWTPSVTTLEWWTDALEVGALVNLRVLQLVVVEPTPEGCAWLLDSKLGRQLEVLELVHVNPSGQRAFPIAVAPWLDVAARLTVRVRWKTWSGPVTVEAAAGRVAVEVPAFMWQDAGDGRTIPAQLREALAGFPDPRAPALELRCNLSLRGHLRRLLADYFATVS